MLEKVVYVTVFVKNQDKAIDFYTKVMGFKLNELIPESQTKKAISLKSKVDETFLDVPDIRRNEAAWEWTWIAIYRRRRVLLPK